MKKAAFRRKRLKAAKRADGLLAVGDGHVILHEFGEAVDTQQVADGLDDHHDADGHHQHIAVERRIDDDGDCQHESASAPEKRPATQTRRHHGDALGGAEPDHCSR